MLRILITCLFGTVLLFSSSQQSPYRNHSILLANYKLADQVYKKAAALALRSENDESLVTAADREYQKAGDQMLKLIPEAIQAGHDSLLFFIHLKAGLARHYFDSLQEAKNHYLSAIALRTILHIPDSFYFQPYLYAGNILFRQDKLDSAQLLLKEAEQLAGQYPFLKESERLYNLLGVMHYENGNYRQAVIYFEKALSLIHELNPKEKSLQANYKINIASTLLKTEENAKAKKILEELLQENFYTNELYHKLGLVYLKENNYHRAIQLFSKVVYGSNKKNIDLYLNFSQAFSYAGSNDSAEQYLHRALAENLKWNGHQRNTSYGLLLKFQADQLAQKGFYKETLPLYQQSIMQFDHHFSETDVNKNPEQFSAVYSYINLFNTLTAKGDALEKIYEQEQEITALAAALYAYRSAFKLADYVERTYNSDEARLFIGQIKHAVHSRPIDIGIQLFNLTQKKEYLEEVYYFDQRNKASVLSFNIRQQALQAKLKSEDDSLYKTEAAIQSSITRLSIKASLLTDSTQLSLIDARIRDLEIDLDKLREEINANPQRQALLATERIPAVNHLHRQLDNTTAILSYHLSRNELLILLITANRFEYYKVPLTSSFYTEIESFRNALYQAKPGERYNGTHTAISLYRTLINPVLGSISPLNRLVIIPDDELNYLPFEALQDENKHYLFEKFAVQYQYSTALLGNKNGSSSGKSMLSFAPFSSKGFEDTLNQLSHLPASADEVKGLEGKILLDTAATRKNFMELANHSTIVHLATHARADNDNPSQSYISFYPGTESSRLYAREIYDLQLDTTRLIILSACETGSGQLIKGEGMMSLSRAFAYAGCPNIITSLWKAEDRTTAFITQRLHYYLDKKETMDKALQMAKADLMKNPDIRPGMKTPNYWAHLVLIGEYEPDHKRNNWPWVAAGIMITLLSFYFLKRKNPPAPESKQV